MPPFPIRIYHSLRSCEVWLLADWRFIRSNGRQRLRTAESVLGQVGRANLECHPSNTRIKTRPGEMAGAVAFSPLLSLTKRDCFGSRPPRRQPDSSHSFLRSACHR